MLHLTDRISEVFHSSDSYMQLYTCQFNHACLYLFSRINLPNSNWLHWPMHSWVASAQVVQLSFLVLVFKWVWAILMSVEQPHRFIHLWFVVLCYSDFEPTWTVCMVQRSIHRLIKVQDYSILMGTVHTYMNTSKKTVRHATRLLHCRSGSLVTQDYK